MANRALLVGINAYPTAPLNGCVNDVTDAAQFIVDRCAFGRGEVRLLTDARATTDGIMERLGWLVGGAAPGDRLYFHYSGHGTLYSDRQADGSVGPVHGAICPVDFDWSRQHAILDDDLRGIIDRVPEGVEFVYVSDSCNSGDLTRALRSWRARYLPPPADIAWRLQTAYSEGYIFRPFEHDRCALISGCRADQESADAVFGGRYNGALTYFLLRQLGQHDGLGLALGPLVQTTRGALSAAHYPQEPQLRGPPELLGRAFLEV